jgi:hypothetical protein
MKNTLLILLALAAGTLAAQDMGDAPAPYPTAVYFQSGGGTRLDYLGSSCSDDSGTAPVPGGWTGDDADDGCEFLNMHKGGAATLNIAVVDTNGNDDLAVWMDFNNDGDWDDAGERVVWAGRSSAATHGAFAARVQPPYGGSSTSFNSYSVAIPASAVGSSVKVRVRLWDTAQHSSGPMALNGGGDPGAFSEFGEVEDFDILYGTSTGARLAVYEMGGTTPINHATTFNAGSITAGVQTNLFFDLSNLRNASHFLRFTTAYPNATITHSNAQNCSISLFTPGNGVTVLPGDRFAFIATVTVSSGGSPFSFQLAIPTNDPLVPTYSFTVSGNGAQPAPKLELQRPAYTTIPSSGSDNVGDRDAGTASTISWYIFNNGQLQLDLTGSPLVQLGAYNNCAATVSAQPPATSLPGGGWSMTFSVDITPTTAGSGFSFTISISSNDPASNPYLVTVTGSAVASGGGGGGGTPAISVSRSGSALSPGGADNLGFFISGGTTNFVYDVSNVGSAPLSFTGNPRVAVSSVSNCTVSVTQQLPAGLAAGTSAPFVISLGTANSGALAFTLTISSDDPAQGVFTINVQGSTGSQPPSFDLVSAKGGAGGGGGCTSSSEGGAVLLLLAILTAALVRRRSSAAPVRKR